MTIERIDEPSPEEPLQTLLLMRAFLRAPRSIAAIAPSSRDLADAIASKVDVGESTHVLELGVGTGALTDSLLSKGLSPSQYTGVELEPALVVALRTKYPRMTFLREPAEELQRIVSNRKIAPSHIVASLPWTCMTRRVRRRLLSRIADALDRSGCLVTYSYVSSILLLGSARRTAEDFRGRFRSIGRSRIIWRNLPPATVWVCSP